MRDLLTSKIDRTEALTLSNSRSARDSLDESVALSFEPSPEHRLEQT
jgi:hypothetical protein